MDNKRKEYIYWGSMGFTLFATALALSSGGMYFIENLSIQFFEDEPSPAVNLLVIALSAIALAVFMVYCARIAEKEDAKNQIQIAPEVIGAELRCGRTPATQCASTVFLDHSGEVPLNEMKDGERILLKCFIYCGDGLKHAFYRVLVKKSDEKGALLVDQLDSSNWRQEDTKTFGPWGNLAIKNNTNYDGGSKYKEVPY